MDSVSQKIRTAIITVTYNSADYITEFLEAIKPELSNSSREVILVIVDNNSTDETISVINNFATLHNLSSELIVLPQNLNLGFGKGCNLGAVYARQFASKYYWFLNPDTRIFPDTRVALQSFLDQSPDYGFAGSMLLNVHGEISSSAFRFPSVISEFIGVIRLGFLDRLFSSRVVPMLLETENPGQAQWLTGASFMVSAEIFHELQGFDPNFFLYFEEVDLFYRARNAGYSAWVVPASKVYHIAGASTGISFQRRRENRRPKYWFESRRYFYNKNFGRLYCMLCDLALIVGLLLWKLRMVVQRKPGMDPPYFLFDVITNSAFLNR